MPIAPDLYVVLKAGLDSRVEDKAWGLKEVVTLAYAAEMAVDRTVEVNDGKQAVELRHFVTSRNVKLLCDVEDAALTWGPSFWVAGLPQAGSGDRDHRGRAGRRRDPASWGPGGRPR